MCPAQQKIIMYRQQGSTCQLAHCQRICLSYDTEYWQEYSDCHSQRQLLRVSRKTVILERKHLMPRRRQNLYAKIFFSIVAKPKYD